MKKLIVVFFLLVSALAFAQKPNTYIKGQLKGLSKDKWIYLSGFGGGFKDSVQQKKDGFRFSLNIPEGEGDFYILQVDKTPSSGQMNGVIIFLEDGNLQINGETALLKEAVFSGGILADHYNKFQNREKIFGLEELYARYAKADKSEKESLLEEIYALTDKQKNLDKEFVRKNKDSAAIVYPLFFSLRDRDNLSELDEILKEVDPKAKNNIPIKKMEYSIKADRLTGVGNQAIEFSQVDTSGNLVSLSDFRGKYVLIDFWASWCVPCRIENPHVVAAYQQFKNKDFTVLGISFDNPGQHTKWVDAIKNDNLDWYHVSDLKGWKNEVGVLYDINSIPFNLLLGPDGKILAKNLRGKQLEEKLGELLGEPSMEDNTFVIKGKLENINQPKWFYLSYSDSTGKNITDSSRIFNGSFSKVGKINSPSKVRASISYSNNSDGKNSRNYFEFYLEPGVISLEDTGDEDVQEIKIIGSDAEEEYRKYLSLTRKQRDALRPISRLYNEKSAEYGSLKRNGASEAILKAKLEECEELMDKMSPFHSVIREKNLEYIRRNPDSFVSVSELSMYVSSMSFEEILRIYDQMSAEVQNSVAGLKLQKEIQNLKGGSPGSVASDFEDKDINGELLKLSNFRGKYVLIDFWASWCVPCRKGNPELLSLYSKYKEKGFEIIGVSDDDHSEEAWHKAIEQDGIGVWKHVLRGLVKLEDGRYDKSKDKSEPYGVHTLPTKILVNPDGVIVGRYGGGGGTDADLKTKLNEIFKD